MKLEKISDNEYRLGTESRSFWLTIGLMLLATLGFIGVGYFMFFKSGFSIRSELFPKLFLATILIQLVAGFFMIKRNLANLPKSIIKTGFGTLEIKDFSCSLSDVDSLEVCRQVVRSGSTNLSERRNGVASNYHLGIRINGKYRPLAYFLTLNNASRMAETLADFLKKPVTHSSKFFGPL